jgi:hypothetical protein
MVVAAPASSQDPGSLGIEHYYAYLLQTQFFAGFTVTLTDQFLQSEHDVEFLELFSLPVDKNGEGISDLTTHYTWWRIARNLESSTQTVTVTNQFGDQLLQVGDAAYLLNPALKNTVPNTGIPKGRVAPNEENQADPDHFKCYSVLSDPVNLTATLSHQFGSETPVVLNPVYLCNPAEKVLPDGTVYPVNNLRGHFVCYQVANGIPLEGKDVIVTDQFIAANLLLETPELLCVPSEKQIPVQPSEGTWGMLKSIYR